MRVALVHDWLNGMRGGERCLEALLTLFPKASISTLFHVPGTTSARIDSRVRKVSFLNRIPGCRRFYRMFLPLYPWAVSRFRFDGFSLVISLSHAAVKNVDVPDGVRHITYCFTPMRYIWDQATTYFGRLTFLLWPLIVLLRYWDKRASGHNQELIAISRFVAARIRCFYGLRARIIYPPVETSWLEAAGLEAGAPPERAFLYAGALVPYKRADLAIRVCTELELPLWVAGTGPELRRLRAMAGPTIRFLGPVSDAQLAGLYRNCRALIFPAKEDFGIVPVECMAAGRPVIAPFSGACRETIKGIKIWNKVRLEPSESTGVFFRRAGRSKALEPLRDAVRYFLEHESRFSSDVCREQARRFAPERFYQAWAEVLKEGPAERGGPDRG